MRASKNILKCSSSYYQNDDKEKEEEKRAPDSISRIFHFIFRTIHGMKIKFQQQNIRLKER